MSMKADIKKERKVIAENKARRKLKAITICGGLVGVVVLASSAVGIYQKLNSSKAYSAISNEFIEGHIPYSARQGSSFDFSDISSIDFYKHKLVFNKGASFNFPRLEISSDDSGESYSCKQEGGLIRESDIYALYNYDGEKVDISEKSGLFQKDFFCNYSRAVNYIDNVLKRKMQAIGESGFANLDENVRSSIGIISQDATDAYNVLVLYDNPIEKKL